MQFSRDYLSVKGLRVCGPSVYEFEISEGKKGHQINGFNFSLESEN